MQNRYYPLYKRGEYSSAPSSRIALLNCYNKSHFELLAVEDTRNYPGQQQYKEAATGIRFEPQGQGANNCLYLAYIAGSKLQSNEITLDQARNCSFAREAAALRQTVARDLEEKLWDDFDFRVSVLSHFIQEENY